MTVNFYWYQNKKCPEHFLVALEMLRKVLHQRGVQGWRCNLEVNIMNIKKWFSGFSTPPKALFGVWVCGSHNSRSEINRNMQKKLTFKLQNTKEIFKKKWYYLKKNLHISRGVGGASKRARWGNSKKTCLSGFYKVSHSHMSFRFLKHSHIFIVLIFSPLSLIQSFRFYEPFSSAIKTV